jgi:hypothetical protein
MPRTPTVKNTVEKFIKNKIYTMCKFPTIERFRGIFVYDNIDVSRVTTMMYRRRWFMIFDRHLPITIDMDYYEPHNSSELVIGHGRHPTVSNITTLELYTTVSTRVATERDAVNVMSEIAMMSGKLRAIRSAEAQKMRDAVLLPLPLGGPKVVDV